MKNIKKALYLMTLILYATTAVAQDYWAIINTPPDVGIGAVEVNSNGDIFIGVGFTSGGGVQRKQYNGNVWDTSLFLNYESIGAFFIDEYDNIFAAGLKLYYSDSNGDNWDTIFISESFGITCIFKDTDNTLLIGKWGGIYKSDSIFINWSKVLDLKSYEVVFAMTEDISSGALYAGTTNFINGGGVYRSIDGGGNWEHIGLTDHYVSSLAMNSSGDLFAGTRGHNTFGGGGVFVLYQGQNEWEQLLDGELVTSMVINSEDVIFIGCSGLNYYGGGVRRSMDNGTTWEDISLETMHARDIEQLVLGPDEYLYALEHNSPTPLYKSISPTITSTRELKLDETILTYNYPNPFSDETTIYFELPLSDPIEAQITIYNSQGNKIKDIALPKYFGKEQSIKWKPKQLPAGIYYYELTAGNIRTFNKMALQN